MKKICQYCGEQLGFFTKECPNCGATYEECSHCEETDSYNDSRYYRDSSDYGSSYSQPMHDQPQHQQRPVNRQYAQPQYQRSQYQPQYTYAGAKNVRSKAKTTAIFVAIIIAIAVIMIVVAVASTFGAMSYKSALKDYFGSFEDCNGEDYITAQITEDMLWDFYGYSIDEVDELYDIATERLLQIQSMLELRLGDDVEVSYTVTDEDELDEYELSEINYVLSYVDLYFEVDKGYDIDLEIEIEGDEDSETYDAYAQVFKVDGSWIISSLECPDCSVFDVYSITDAYYDSVLSIMNRYAEEVFNAAETYAQYCKSAGKPINPGVVIGGDSIEDGEVIGPSKSGDIIKLPTTDQPTYNDILEGINTCVTDGMIGYVYCVEFDEDGMPCGVICAEDADDAFVGSYPREADFVKITLSEAKGE